MITYRQPFAGDFPITQRYREVIPGVTYQGKPHTGIDYGCPEGTRILASADGQVMAAGWDLTGYGYRVIIRHTAECSTLYAHLQGQTVRVGQQVKQGDMIGVSGSTGNVTGPHLHFEARRVWNDFTSHFDPMSLPLMSVDDSIHDTAPIALLKEPADLTEIIIVSCPDGARVFNQDWSIRNVGFPQGTKLHFTGKTAKRPGFPDLTYCEVYEEPRKYYVAVHDGKTQILDNAEK